jgi:PAS domain S-box-containing protein
MYKEKPVLILPLCAAVVFVTASLQWLYPLSPYLDGGVIITVLLTFYLKSRVYTLALGILGIMVVIAGAFLPHANFTEAQIVMQHGFSLGIIIFSIFAVLHVKKLGTSVKTNQLQTQALFENAAEGVFLTNRQGEIVLVNDAAHKLFGYGHGELLGQSIDVLIPDEFKHSHAGHRATFYKHPSSRYVLDRKDLNGRKKDGTEFPVEVGLSFYTQGNEMYVISFVLDVTERKQAQQQLLQSELRFKNLVQNITDIIMMVDEEGNIQYVSPSVTVVLGYAEDELGQKSLLGLIHAVDCSMVTNWLAPGYKPTQQGSINECRMLHKNGSYRFVEVNSNSQLQNPAVGGIILTIRDVTARRTREEEKNRLLDELSKKNEESIVYEKALKESEEKYRYLFENNPAPIFIWDFETLQMIDCNEETLLKYGYTREEFLQLNIKQIRPAEDIPLIEKATQTPETYGAIHNQVWRHKKKNGDIMINEVNAHLFMYNNRLASIVHINDITEKFRAQQEIKASEERYKMLFYKSPLPKWIYDTNTLVIVDVNETAQQLYGYTRNEFLRMRVTSFTAPQEGPAFVNMQQNITRDDTVHLFGTFTHVQKSTALIKVELYGYKFSYAGRDCMLLAGNDVTDRLAYITSIETQNEKLKEIAWMESHIIRLPLSRMMGLINLIQDDAIAEPEKKELLAHVLTSAYELDDIIMRISNKTFQAKIR